MNILIDIDGTICEDIPNSESEKFISAKVIDNSVEHVNRLYQKGHNITFFTARLEEHRQITEKWLDINNFNYHQLIMGKPSGGKYIWIDNLDVHGIKYKDNWINIITQIDSQTIFSKSN